MFFSPADLWLFQTISALANVRPDLFAVDAQGCDGLEGTELATRFPLNHGGFCGVKGDSANVNVKRCH